MQAFTQYNEKEMLFQIKTSITKKEHNGDFTISVMLLRNAKPVIYIIKVIISKFIGVNDNLFGPNSLIMD
jgi:ornithine cyclodeaminase/alanine dehydrogenase-like protein (mu-crystallin family)